jgi:hypothetical protein
MSTYLKWLDETGIDEIELVGGKKPKRKSKKTGGNDGEFTGAYDWKTQLALDAEGNMAGGKKTKPKRKSK